MALLRQRDLAGDLLPYPREGTYLARGRSVPSASRIFRACRALFCRRTDLLFSCIHSLPLIHTIFSKRAAMSRLVGAKLGVDEFEYMKSNPAARRPKSLSPTQTRTNVEAR